METRTNHTDSNEGAKTVEKLFNDSTETMMEIYKKQMALTMGFYNNFFNSTLGNSNGWNPNGNFPNVFFNNDMTKWFSNPPTIFSANNFSNPFLAPMEKAMKQMMEFNQNLLSAFTGGIQGKGFDFGSVSEGYMETINARMEASKKILSTISEAFNKQLESSIEINKKAMEEISNQVNLVMKQNQKFWAGTLKTYQVPFDGEEKNKAPMQNENKKRSNFAADGLLDHKS